jgi:hypothetical protein
VYKENKTVFVVWIVVLNGSTQENFVKLEDFSCLYEYNAIVKRATRSKYPHQKLRSGARSMAPEVSRSCVISGSKALFTICYI